MGSPAETREKLHILIPVLEPNQIEKYHDALLRLLREIHIEDCRPLRKEDIKLMYELLYHLEKNKKLFDNKLIKRKKKSNTKSTKQPKK